MCIVIVKKKGIDIPTDKIIENCFENNPDGAGVMYLTTKGVKINKGFMSLNSLNGFLQRMNFKKGDTVVYHFRYATHGLTAKGQTHPFPISEVDKELMTTKGTYDVAMAHNGVLSAMQSDKVLSDTMLYIKHIVSPIKEMIFDSAMKSLLTKSSIGSRLVFLNKMGEVLTTGEGWQTDKGLKFSNSGYLINEWQYLDDDDDDKIEYTDCQECEECENISYSEREGYCYECAFEGKEIIKMEDYYNEEYYQQWHN